MSQNQNWEDFQFEEPLGKLVSLPTAVMERICRLLGYKDQYEFANSPNWSIAAMAILWEAPLFSRPDSLRKFLKTASTCKRVALLVKRFHLAFVDIEEESLFKPLCRSSSERHHSKNAHPLAKASLIKDLARHCENITDLVCYGWEMKPGDWEQIATVAHELKHLTVIGGSKQGEPKQIGVQVLSRLETLCLDGRFGINDSWAQALIHKASNLRVLELSLENLDYDVFMKICQPGHLPLTKLTLTRAGCLLDIHVAHILAGFPDLNSFCLEGTLSASAATIMACLGSCAVLEHLEIRANALSIEKSEKVQLETPPLDHILALKSLLVENLNLTDSNLQMLGVWLPQLRTLGLKNCRLLTNQSLQYLVRNLTTIHLLDCPQLDSGFFSFLKHLRELYIKSCGTMAPNDIYNVCSQCDNLQSIKIIGYQDLRDSMIDRYMEKTQEPRLVLNKTQIKTLAKTGLQYIPKERVLSGHHILLLAQHLEMPTKDLDSLLDLIEQETMNAQVCNKESLKNRLSRLEVLKSDNSSVIPRPNTPAIWSKDYQNQPNKSDTEEEEEINLGGWGLNQDTAKSWADIPTQVIDDIPTLEDIQISTQVIKEPWRHQDAFLSPENKKPKAKPFMQDVQIKEDTSGWGYPGQMYDWNDYSNQGYAHDVIEEQKETVYYENGEKRNLQEDASSFPIQPLFSSSTAEIVSLFSSAEPMQRKQSMAVISSDEGPDWDNDSEEERIVVKVNDKTQKEIEPFYPKKRMADMMPKKNTSRQFSRPGRISPEVCGSAEDQWANIAKSNPERKRRPPRQKNNERKKDWRAESNEHLPEIPNLISLDDSQQVSRARTFFPTDPNHVLVPERACTPKSGLMVDLMNEMMIDSTSEVTMKDLIRQEENKDMLKKVTTKDLTVEEEEGDKGFSKELRLEDLMMEEENNKGQMTLEDVMTEIKSKEAKKIKRRMSVSSCSTDSMDWRDKEYDAMNTASWEYTTEENMAQSPQSSYDETDQCETPVDHLGLNKDVVDSPKIQTKVKEVLTEQLSLTDSYNTATNPLPEFSSLMNDFSEKQSQSEQEPYYINDQVSSVSSIEPIRLQPNATEDIMFESLMEEFSPSAQSTSSAEVNTPDNQTAVQTTNYNDTPQTVIDNPYDLTREYLKSNRRRLRYVTTVMVGVSEKENKCLHMFKDEKVEVTIKKFCEKYNVQNIEKQLNGQLADIYKKNRTDLIMKKKI
ncbi:unnamed protein product [Rhizopus stolonifer]